MTKSTLTSKGQTTVPQEVREALGVKGRQQLVWTIRKDGSAVVRPQPGAASLFGSLRPVDSKFKSRRAERKATMELIGKHAAEEGLR